MAFVPNTAAPAPIILHHTPSDTASPALLYPGEAAVCHGPLHTKMWIGDGITNRLFLSTNPADSPLLNQTVLGGPFLPLSGGTLAGPGNLTLDGGTLTVSGATPIVVWDKTGTDPIQWELRTADATFPDRTIWGLHDGVNWRFYLQRVTGPPVAYEYYINVPLVTAGAAVFGDWVSTAGYISCGSAISANAGIVSHGGAITSILRSDTTSPRIGLQRARQTGNIQTGDVIGLQTFISVEQGGGTWQSAVIQAVATENHGLNIAGTELQFWTAPNGGITMGHARHAMTLGQDGNLSLPHAVPTAASDVVTLGYLTGAGTGFLSLTGGTLTGPGNLAVNGTLAVSNSDTVSATITNTGSGATGLRITASGTGGTALELIGETYALKARREVLIGPLYGANWHFTSSLNGSTTNAAANLMDLSGDGGGIRIRPSSRTVDPPGIYGGVGIFRHLTSNTAAFVQLISASGLGMTSGTASNAVLGSIWFGGYNGTDQDYPYNPQVLKSASIYTEATENWSGTATGSRMLFEVTPNGTTTAQTALTIENDGSLKVSGANPAMIWDVTGGSAGPVQWRVEAEDDWWGLADVEKGTWPFSGIRSSDPSYAFGFEDASVWIEGNLDVVGQTNLQAIYAYSIVTAAEASFWSAEASHGMNVGARSELGSSPTARPELNLRTPVPITSADQILGDIWAWGFAGIDNTTDLSGAFAGHSISAAGIRFLSTQGWQRDTVVDPGDPGPPIIPPSITSRTDQLGSEIAFFVSADGGPAPYRAMTLEQDGSVTVVGTVTASGSLLTSDPALKNNITQAPSGALAKVCELPVIDFRWKRGRDSKVHRGFSADDVRRVMGEDSGCSAEGAYSLADMNAMLWQATQELCDRVETLERALYDRDRS